MTQITKAKNEHVEHSEKPFFPLLQFLSRKLNFENGTRVVYKKAYDTTRARRTSSDTIPFQHSLQHSYNITNH